MIRNTQKKGFTQHHFSKKRNDAGFTLMELLVVIAIIGILSSVVLVSLNQARVKARDTSRITDIKQIQLALELYFDSNSSSYPTSLADLAPIYIQVEPKDPSTGASYMYAYDPATNPTDYHLGAVLEDSANTILTEDVDRNSTAGGESFAGGTGFNGASDDCGTGSGAEQCFDVRP